MTQKLMGVNRPKIKRSELDSLSNEELAQIAISLQKVDQANEYRKLDSYLETANCNQVPFHKNGHRIRFFFGSNRSGKTTGGSVEAYWAATGTHPFRKCPVPSKGIIIAQDYQNHVNNVLWPKIQQWTPPGSFAKVEKNQTGAVCKLIYKVGSTVDIMSHDQDLKVFEGGDYDWAWFDEPPPYKIFVAVWRGLTDRGGHCWITCTPLTAPWLYREYKKALAGDDLRWFIFAKMTDNAKNIGDGDEAKGLKRIEEFAAMLDPEERAARLEGQFIQMQGLIFKTFEQSHHIIKPFAWPQGWPIIESIDPHPRKPWAVSWLGLTENDHVILLKSVYLEGDIDQVGQGIILERANLGIEHGRPPRIIRSLIDNYANAPMMTKSSHMERTARQVTIREELEAVIGPRANGPRLEVAPKDVHQKIDIFKRWLRIEQTERGPRSKFYVFDNSDLGSFLDEVENYVWDQYRGNSTQGLFKDAPKKTGDDILDTIMQVALTLQGTNKKSEPYKVAGNLATYGSRGNNGSIRRDSFST